ncbi:MAG: radical SAM protein [Muribaculaceae bacterium]|nr:radical SAM protein [Muribaculaceae bacterium]
MKPSKYNYIFQTPSGSYWMNGITKSTLKFSTDLGEKVEELLTKSALIKESSTKLFNLLVNGGFIIDDSTNEIDVIRDLYQSMIARKDYFLIVLPTLNCNLQCHYCVQSHIPSQMSSETMNAVMRHIQFMVEHEKIDSLYLEWFGGEPFMYFEEVIKPISQFAKEICESANIPFYAGATSNGVLISHDFASQLPEINLSRFQITLDGDKKLHNQIKYSNDIESAFDTTLINIANIIKVNPQVYITLRINYTDDTLKTNLVREVCDRLPKEARQNVTITLKKVWQHGVDLNRFDSYLEVLKQFNQAGFKVNWLDIAYNFYPCYVNKKYYTCINFNGNLLKCTNSSALYSTEPHGFINTDGSLEWKNQLDNKTQEAPFENSNCLRCKRLPICMGQCPRNHMEMKQWHCKWESLDIDLKKAIIAHIDYELATTNS